MSRGSIPADIASIVSDLKKVKLGSKGIGRFFYLKIFEKVHIESLNKMINFVIDKGIDVSELEKLEYDKTSVLFEKPKIQFTVDYSKLEQQIRDHFIAYFRLLNNEKVTIKISQNDVEQVKIIMNP
jgi:hypothetical protein